MNIRLIIDGSCAKKDKDMSFITILKMFEIFKKSATKRKTKMTKSFGVLLRRVQDHPDGSGHL